MPLKDFDQGNQDWGLKREWYALCLRLPNCLIKGEKQKRLPSLGNLSFCSLNRQFLNQLILDLETFAGLNNNISNLIRNRDLA